MDTTEVFERSRRFSKEFEEEGPFDWKPRQRADNDFLLGVTTNPYPFIPGELNRKHKLYAEQMEVCKARVPVITD